MKSKIPWQYAAILLFSLISLDCKKDINQKEMARLTQDDGSATTLGITCISNGIQFFKTEALSQARELSKGIGLGNKVLFVGGQKKIPGGFIVPSARVDIYNTSSDSWTDKIFTFNEGTFNNATVGTTGQALAAGGTKIGIAGGVFGDGTISDRLDIYDVNSDVWTISQLPTLRAEAAGVGYGDFLYFAGGFGKKINAHKSIDVYNTLNGSWTKLSLSLARSGLAAAATNNKILFAGGETGTGVTDRVDIYDVPTGTWSVSALSKARTKLVGAALGNLIIFAGGFDLGNQGGSLDNIDIYNTSTGQWSVSHMSTAAGWRQSAVQGTKMFFSGDNTDNNPGPAEVDVYDICSNTWSKLALTDGRGGFGSGAAGGKVLFAGGFFINGTDETFVKTVDIFNLGSLIAQ